MASKIAQDSPTWFKIVFKQLPRALKIAPRRLQAPSGPPKEAPKKPKSFKKQCVFSMFFAFPPFHVRWALEASRWLQDGPRGPQDGPKSAQERPKRAPGGIYCTATKMNAQQHKAP